MNSLWKWKLSAFKCLSPPFCFLFSPRTCKFFKSEYFFVLLRYPIFGFEYSSVLWKFDDTKLWAIFTNSKVGWVLPLQKMKCFYYNIYYAHQFHMVAKWGEVPFGNPRQSYLWNLVYVWYLCRRLKQVFNLDMANVCW